MGSEVTLTPAIKYVRKIARKKIDQDDVKKIGRINSVFQADPKKSDVAQGVGELFIIDYIKELESSSSLTTSRS